MQTGAQQELISAVALRNFKLPAFDICEAEALRAAVEVLRNKPLSNSRLIPSLYRLPHYRTACSLQLLPASPGLMDFACPCPGRALQADAARPPPARRAGVRGARAPCGRAAAAAAPKCSAFEKQPWLGASLGAAQAGARVAAQKELLLSESE